MGPYQEQISVLTTNFVPLFHMNLAIKRLVASLNLYRRYKVHSQLKQFRLVCEQIMDLKDSRRLLATEINLLHFFGRAMNEIGPILPEVAKIVIDQYPEIISFLHQVHGLDYLCLDGMTFEKLVFIASLSESTTSDEYYRLYLAGHRADPKAALKLAGHIFSKLPLYEAIMLACECKIPPSSGALEKIYNDLERLPKEELKRLLGVIEDSVKFHRRRRLRDAYYFENFYDRMDRMIFGLPY